MHMEPGTPPAAAALGKTCGDCRGGALPGRRRHLVSGRRRHLVSGRRRHLVSDRRDLYRRRCRRPPA